jgi:hypothetical protein
MVTDRERREQGARDAALAGTAITPGMTARRRQEIAEANAARARAVAARAAAEARTQGMTPFAAPLSSAENAMFASILAGAAQNLAAANQPAYYSGNDASATAQRVQQDPANRVVALQPNASGLALAVEGSIAPAGAAAQRLAEVRRRHICRRAARRRAAAAPPRPARPARRAPRAADHPPPRAPASLPQLRVRDAFSQAMLREAQTISVFGHANPVGSFTQGDAGAMTPAQLVERAQLPILATHGGRYPALPAPCTDAVDAEVLLRCASITTHTPHSRSPHVPAMSITLWRPPAEQGGAAGGGATHDIPSFRALQPAWARFRTGPSTRAHYEAQRRLVSGA